MVMRAVSSTGGLIVKIGLTAALLVYFLWRTDFRSIADTLRELSVAHWMVSFLLYLGACLIAGVKWKALLWDQKLTRLLKLNFSAQFYSIILPGQVAGEAIKAYRLGRGRADAERIAASVIIDRITGFLGLLLIAACGISFSDAEVKNQILFTILGALLVLLLGLFSFYFPGWLRLLNAVQTTRPRWIKIADQLRLLLKAWQRYVETPGLMLVSILMGALFQLVAVWINFRIGRELGINIPFADWCWVFGIVSIVVAFPFTVAGIGLREGSFIGTLSLLGASSERAMAHSFAVFSLISAGAIIGGLLEWARIRISSQAAGNLAADP